MAWDRQIEADAKAEGSTIFGRKRWKTSRPDEQSRSMKSSTTSKFWRAYHSLRRRYEPRLGRLIGSGGKTHATLAALERKGEYWSVRIARGWRALGRMHEGALYWFWIGAHDEYQRVLKK